MMANYYLDTYHYQLVSGDSLESRIWPVCIFGCTFDRLGSLGEVVVYLKKIAEINIRKQKKRINLYGYYIFPPLFS